MQVADLVKYVGHAAMYRDRLGIVTKLYSTSHTKSIDSALVHFDGLYGKGRDAPGLGQVNNGLHPMSLDELERV
tara:strand:+ start:6 stop:227 length:222 start_codon:yes stop_codon:yes gene_type:complete